MESATSINGGVESSIAVTGSQDPVAIRGRAAIAALHERIQAREINRGLPAAYLGNLAAKMAAQRLP